MSIIDYQTFISEMHQRPAARQAIFARMIKHIMEVKSAGGLGPHHPCLLYSNGQQHCMLDLTQPMDIWINGGTTISCQTAQGTFHIGGHQVYGVYDPGFLHLSPEYAAIQQAVDQHLAQQGQWNPSPHGPQQRSSGDSSELPPELKPFGRELVAEARAGKLDPVIGRKDEVANTIKILSRKNKNNPVLVGPPGVGKTAIVEGLAQRIASGDVPESLKGKKILSLDLKAIMAGTMYRGEFEEKVKTLLDGLKKDGNTILFIDEIHQILRAGAVEGGTMDFANLLKPELARGDLMVMGATTETEFKHIETDGALARRFERVNVGEPSVADAIKIIGGLKTSYEAHHQVTVSDEAVRAAVELSKRYVHDKSLPDKAIDLIDDASVSAGRGNTVTAEHVARELAKRTHIPIEILLGSDSERMANLEKTLSARVINQDTAVKAVSAAARRAYAGLNEPGKPIGSFLFLGKTGVGKTELTKALAEGLLGDETAITRIDMSEYQEKHSVSRLFGSPPGYVGHDSGGQLTEAVRKRPHQVILLDEIDKAHPEVLDTLLQILDDGRLTDGQGRTVDFSNTLVVMTSNFSKQELRTRLRPEMLNRIDEVVRFNDLRPTDMPKIVDKFIGRLQARIGDKYTLTVDASMRSWLAEEGFDAEMGARPLNRLITRSIIDNLAKLRPPKDADVKVVYGQSDEGAGKLLFYINGKAQEPIDPPEQDSRYHPTGEMLTVANHQARNRRPLEGSEMIAVNTGRAGEQVPGIGPRMLEDLLNRGCDHRARVKESRDPENMTLSL